MLQTSTHRLVSAAPACLKAVGVCIQQLQTDALALIVVIALNILEAWK
jgi:hypothetical protein